MSGPIVVALILFVLLLMYVSFLCGAWRSVREGMEEDSTPVRPEHRPGFRRFYGRRDSDVTGISGEGIVVEGVVFSDGFGVTHWLNQAPQFEPKTDVWYKPFLRPGGGDAFTKISGHGGRTTLVWVDERDIVRETVESESDMMEEGSRVRMAP